MVMREVSVSTFKAQALALLAEVAATGEEIVVTKRGQPLARVLPAREPAPLTGSVRFLVSDDELVAPIEVAWDAEADDRP
jgi:prevent-host-death family protein